MRSEANSLGSDARQDIGVPDREREREREREKERKKERKRERKTERKKERYREREREICIYTYIDRERET